KSTATPTKSYPMRIRLDHFARAFSTSALPLLSVLATRAVAQGSASTRPMTFLDMRLQRNASAFAPSPDGKWMLYTIQTPDWKEAKSQSDVYLVSLDQGVR